MGIFLLDAVCALLFLGGLVIAFKRQARPNGDTFSASEQRDVRTYIRRIAGVMLAAFSLALAVIFTTFHVYS